MNDDQVRSAPESDGTSPAGSAGTSLLGGPVDPSFDPDGLAELERSLTSHPAIARSVSLIREDDEGYELLLAYAVPVEGARPPTPAQLLDHVSGRLQPHLVPDAVALLAELPLTASGDLDLDALPEPGFGSGPERPPRTAQEELLCELFAAVLDMPSVAVDDDFFELGGDSLLATRLVGRIKSVLNMEPGVRDLFEAPTVEALTERMSSRNGGRPPLVAARRPERVPANSGQRRMWFAQQWDGSGALYNMPVALRLSGSLDRAALRIAIADVVERHEALRTLHQDDDGSLHQVVVPPGQAVVELRESAVTEEELPAALDREAARGFDLATGLPVRAALFEVGGDEHVLLLVVHHIAGDGWSMGIVERDLSRAYSARLAGREPVWELLAVQCADHTLWQQALLGDEDDPDSLAARQLAYWREALAGLPEELALPADRPRPSTPSHRGGSIPLDLAASLHARLRSMARQHKATLFMVLQAGLGALLTRLGAGGVVPVGIPVAGRTDPALDDVVGHFLNTLVLRIDTTGDPAYEDLVARVRDSALEAYAHQDIPFDRLVEVLNPARDPARHPLFQVSMVLQNLPPNELSLPGLSVTQVPVRTDSAKFDLAVALQERFDEEGAPRGLSGELAYSSDLFDHATAERIGTFLIRFLEAAVAEPHLPIGELSLMDAAERDRVLDRWNDTAAPVEDAVLPELFERQAALTPGRTAVTDGETVLTYEELNSRANRLAHELIATGAAPEEFVAVSLPRDARLVVAVLAVLKSGAAYLPLDPARPEERIAAVLAKARPRLGLATADTAPNGDNRGTSWLLLDDPQVTASVATRPAGNLSATPDARPAHPLNPAYVLPAPGADGRPQGVLVTHANAVNMLTWVTEHFGAERLAHVPFTASPASGASVLELFPPLLCGGTIEVLPGPQSLTGGPAGAPAPSVAGGTPSALAPITDGESAARSAPALWLSGEPVPATVANALRDAFRADTVHTLYGPAETANCAAHGSTNGPVDAVPPIGRPLRNIRCYVLDEALRPVPHGVAGELYIAGAGVTRGYLAEPGPTAERYLPDPFGPPGGRMYGTGEPVRWTAHGELVRLGWGDERAEARGPGTRTGTPGSPALAEVSCPAGAGRLPRTPHEELLCELFAAVLEVPAVAVDDNFFELGGHSLLATRLVQRISAVLGVRVPVQSVFVAPTVQALARELRSLGDPAGEKDEGLLDPVIRLHTGGSGSPLFCVHAATGLSWSYATLLPYIGTAHPLHGVQATGGVGTGNGPGTLEELASEYAGLIREVQPHGPYRLAGWSLGGVIAQAVATHLQEEGEKTALLALLDAYPFAAQRRHFGLPDDFDPEQEALDALLTGLGIEDGPGAGTPLERGPVADALSDVLDLPRAAASRLVDAAVRNTRLADAHVPRVLRGRVVFFAADEEPGGLSADAWAPYVDGPVDVHEVGADHYGMLRWPAVEEIGRVLAAELHSRPN